MTYLKNSQVAEMKAEAAILTSKLENTAIQDKGAVRRQLISTWRWLQGT